MTQQQSGEARSSFVLPLLAAIVLIAVFVALEVKRLPFDGPLSYDEGTHLSEGVEVRDALAARDWPRVANYFLEKKVMKGIIYRLWYGVTFLFVAPGADDGRLGGIAGCALALLAIFLLARSLAPEGLAGASGLFAVVFAVCAPIVHRLGRMAMVEPINLFALALALALLVRDRRQPSLSRALLAALALLFAIVTKYNHALILVLASGLDATIELARGLKAKTPWKQRLRPFLPLAIAFSPVIVLLANPSRLSSILYYIKTVPGGQDPVNLKGMTYVHTLFTRIAPWSVGCALLVVLVVATAIWLVRKQQPGARLVALHLAIGFALAQANDLKLERIIVPLLGGAFAFGGVGAARLVDRLRSIRITRTALATGLAALVVALFFGLPSRELYAVIPNPYRVVDECMTSGIEFARGHGKTLWLGGDFGNGWMWNSAALRLRLRELGSPIPESSLEFGGAEFLFRSKIDVRSLRQHEAVRGAVTDLLRPYQAVVVMHDPGPKEPVIRDPAVRNLLACVVEFGEFKRATEPRSLLFPAFMDIPAQKARFEIYVRVRAPGSR